MPWVENVSITRATFQPCRVVDCGHIGIKEPVSGLPLCEVHYLNACSFFADKSFKWIYG